jgi:hypothetical protein
MVTFKPQMILALDDKENVKPYSREYVKPPLDAKVEWKLLVTNVGTLTGGASSHMQIYPSGYVNAAGVGAQFSPAQMTIRGT